MLLKARCEGYSRAGIAVNKTFLAFDYSRAGPRGVGKLIIEERREPSSQSRCYTVSAMTPEQENYFLNPPPGSAAARAVEFGIDLTLTLENLRLTPEERIRKLDNFILAVQRLKASARRVGPAHAAFDEDN